MHCSHIIKQTWLHVKTYYVFVERTPLGRPHVQISTKMCNNSSYHICQSIKNLYSVICWEQIRRITCQITFVCCKYSCYCNNCIAAICFDLFDRWLENLCSQKLPRAATKNKWHICFLTHCSCFISWVLVMYTSVDYHEYCYSIIIAYLHFARTDVCK